jgi:hypothetical protein
LQQPGRVPMPAQIERASAERQVAVASQAHPPGLKASPNSTGTTQPEAPPPFARVITITFHQVAWAIVIVSVVFSGLVCCLELWDNPRRPALWPMLSAVVALLGMIGFAIASRRDRRRRAAAGDSVRPDIATVPPPPRRDGWTAFSLGTGFFVLTVGFLTSRLLEDSRLLRWGYIERLHAQASLMLLYAIPALVAFGPGVLFARRRWRWRFGPDGGGDVRAALLAGLGIACTALAIVLTVNRVPYAWQHFFGR